MKPTFTSLFGFVPDHFLPAIGAVMVSHACMDQKLQTAICVMAGMDYSAGVSFLSEVLMTSRRAEIFKNLARTKESDLSQLVKMLVLGDVIVELSSERNIVAHSTPYWRSGDGSEIGYFKEENKTNPQISTNAPYRATVASLTDLAQRMNLVAGWLGALEPNYLPDGVIQSGMSHEEVRSVMKKHGKRGPFWYDDAKFPWPDKFQSKFEKEKNRIQNRHRISKVPAGEE